MKKLWLSLVVAAFFTLAPAARAADGLAAGSLESLLAQIVAFFVGDDAELGDLYPPVGTSAVVAEPEVGGFYPPSGAAVAGDEPEVGGFYPPFGDAVAGDEPESGSHYPPFG